MYSVETKRLVDISQDLMKTAKRVEELKSRVGGVKLGENFGGSVKSLLESSLAEITESMALEAAGASSLGDALQSIANLYREAEKEILGMAPDGALASPHGREDSAEKAGADKRGPLKRFRDWIRKREPDAYEATSKKQEKAADAAMRKELWKVLQDKKYAQKYWDRASVKERKEILQDYMNEVTRIYGLKDVKRKIQWDPDAVYTANRITWGYYSHKRHRVTLNERALTDSVGSWDSYDLLETVSHELRHAYQHEAVDHPARFMVSKATIGAWKKNFANYISSGDDYEGYRAQPVEVDARGFQVGRDDKLKSLG